jgi:hypothetical protein
VRRRQAQRVKVGESGAVVDNCSVFLLIAGCTEQLEILDRVTAVLCQRHDMVGCQLNIWLSTATTETLMLVEGNQRIPLLSCIASIQCSSASSLLNGAEAGGVFRAPCSAMCLISVPVHHIVPAPIGFHLCSMALGIQLLARSDLLTVSPLVFAHASIQAHPAFACQAARYGTIVIERAWLFPLLACTTPSKAYLCVGSHVIIVYRVFALAALTLVAVAILPVFILAKLAPVFPLLAGAALQQPLRVVCDFQIVRLRMTALASLTVAMEPIFGALISGELRYITLALALGTDLGCARRGILRDVGFHSWSKQELRSMRTYVLIVVV